MPKPKFDLDGKPLPLVPKCENCGKEKHHHRAKDSACPLGKKDRTGGYGFPFGEAKEIYKPKVSGNMLADRIDAHLKRMESDPKINKVRRYTNHHGQTSELHPLYSPAACRTGSRISICYILYQGWKTLTFDEARRYLDVLDHNPGKLIKHWEVLEK